MKKVNDIKMLIGSDRDKWQLKSQRIIYGRLVSSKELISVSNKLSITQSFQLSQAAQACLRNQSGRVRNQKSIMPSEGRTFSWGILNNGLIDDN